MQELFSYNGTIYIPLRQAGAWMGKQVDWDQQGKTVVLSGRTRPASWPQRRRREPADSQ